MGMSLQQQAHTTSLMQRIRAMQKCDNDNTIVSQLRHIAEAGVKSGNAECHIANQAANHIEQLEVRLGSKIQDQQFTIVALMLLSTFLCICLLWSVLGG